MKNISVYVGAVEATANGHTQDTRRVVEFTGEELASNEEYGYHKGNLTETRGVTETLYRTEDVRLVVHVKDWSQWQGEPSTEHLVEVTDADIQPGGRFETLGSDAGYGRALTLDEALRPAEDVALQPQGKGK